MQPTQHTTATEISDVQTTNVEAAANACGIAFIRALNVLRESDGPVDLNAFQDDFDAFLAEEWDS